MPAGAVSFLERLSAVRAGKNKYEKLPSSLAADKTQVAILIPDSKRTRKKVHTIYCVVGVWGLGRLGVPGGLCPPVALRPEGLFPFKKRTILFSVRNGCKVCLYPPDEDTPHPPPRWLRRIGHRAVRPSSPPRPPGGAATHPTARTQRQRQPRPPCPCVCGAWRRLPWCCPCGAWRGVRAPSPPPAHTLPSPLCARRGVARVRAPPTHASWFPPLLASSPPFIHHGLGAIPREWALPRAIPVGIPRVGGNRGIPFIAGGK